MKPLLALFFTFFCYTGTAQNFGKPTIHEALKKYGFIQEQLIDQNDTITYYLKGYTEQPSNLVVFIQGTDANPIFSYSINEGKIAISRWFGDDYKQLDASYTYAIIPKPGMAGIYDEAKMSVPKMYYEKNYLDYRVHQVDVAIDDIIQKHLKEPAKIIVYGHSEGATIAAPLALKNKSITHIGFWSGNVLNNFYEFALFNRIESLQGKVSDSIAHQRTMQIVEWYKSVIENPNSTEIDHFGYTNKRWSSYEKAPIDYLLALDIPIYAQFASEDESTPIETAYLLPIQFMQKRKENLTFEVCLGCDHGYQKKIDGKTVGQWTGIFNRFIAWTDKEE